MSGKPWQNLFYQPRSGSGNQYELNVTASFLSVLAEEAVSRSVTEAVINQMCSNLEVTVPEYDEIRYSREVTPDDIRPEGEPRVVIGISPFADDQIPAEPDETDYDFADGTIRFYSEGQPSFTAILEIKNDSAHLRSEQLVRYADRFESTQPSGEELDPLDTITVFSWGDIRTTLMSVKAQSSHAIEEFILNRYISFLWDNEVKKYIGLNVVHDSQKYPVHKYYWQVRRNNRRIEVRLVDEYREHLDEEDELDDALSEVAHLNDLYKRYQTRWFNSDDFESYLGQISEYLRKSAFGIGGEVPSLDPLIENRKKLGPENAQNSREGASLLAEFNRNDKYSQLHIFEDDNPGQFYLDFACEYDDGGRKRDTLELRESELQALIEKLPAPVREALFVNFDFTVVANHLDGEI